MAANIKLNNKISKNNKFLYFLKNNHVFLAIFLSCFAILIGYFAIRSNVSNKEPVVATKAKNSYTETIRVATDKDYRPYSYFDKEGNPAGYDIELINTIFNTMEKNIDLQMVGWGEAVDKIVNEEVDIIMTCDIGDVFDAPIQPLKTNVTSVDEYVVFSKHEIKDLNTFLDGGVAAGYMDNGNAEDQLKKLGILDSCIPYETNKEIFEAIENGTLEAGVMRNNIASMLLKELGYTDIKSRYSIGYSFMCFSVNPNKPELLNDLNNAIRKLSADGVIKELEEKWLTYFVEPYSFGNIIKNESWIVPVVIFSALIFIFFIFTNRRNKKQLKVIHTFTSDFDIVMLVAVEYEKESSFSYYKNKGNFDFILPHLRNKKSFDQYLDTFAKYAVFEDDKAHFLEQINKNKLLNELYESGVHFVNFRGINSNCIQYYQLKFTAIKDKKGNILNCVVGLHNIDKETKNVIRQNEELEESKKIAETASHAKTEFLFNMSHDLRTTMNAVLGYAQNAKHDLMNPEKLEYDLNRIDAAGKSLLDLLNEILEMSRIESGKTELINKNVDVIKNFENLTSIFDISAKEKNIDIEYDFNEIVNKYLFIDCVRFNQIVSNIVGNAIKYTKNGGKVTLKVLEKQSVDENISNYKIIVSDNGIGISKEYQNEIFDSFSREHNSTTTKVTGFGLGMAIVKKLVDLFGGTISITSEVNVGTTVVVDLPLRHGSAPFDEEVLDNDITLSKLKILLVDDNEMNREIGVDMLANKGCEVTVADDGDVAVEMIEKSKPGDFDVILMDIQMPRMNGYEATRRIRSLLNARLANIPIIAFTANAFEEDKKNAFDCGMNGHVSKPIDINQLKAELNKALCKDVEDANDER